jgi:hypothetical protein
MLTDAGGIDLGKLLGNHSFGLESEIPFGIHPLKDRAGAAHQFLDLSTRGGSSMP